MTLVVSSRKVKKSAKQKNGPDKSMISHTFELVNHYGYLRRANIRLTSVLTTTDLVGEPRHAFLEHRYYISRHSDFLIRSLQMSVRKRPLL